jgi:hypothetical protein
MEPVTTSVAAKAVTEPAELLKKQADSFLAAVLGEPARAFGGLLADRINARRHANLIQITVEAKRKLDDAGVSPKEVPLKIINPMLEAASLEEDTDLQRIWANLLANAADPRATGAVLPSFPVILRELTFNDAHFLNKFYEMGYWSHDPDPRTARKAKALWFPPQHLMAYYWHEAIGTESFEVLEQYLQVTLDTLERSGLVTKRYLPPSTLTAVEAHIPPVEFGYEITNLGLMFISACRPPQKS